MRVIEAKSFSGYGGLHQAELPEPQPEKLVTVMPVSWNCASGLVALGPPAKSKVENGAVRV